jgi:hypothetical protein
MYDIRSVVSPLFGQMTGNRLSFEMIQLKRHSLQLIVAILLLWASASGGHAQQQAEAAGEPIELNQNAKTVVIKPGRRVKVFGPTGTAPIKGRLVTMTDSIVLRPDNNRHENWIKKVAVSEVRGVTRRRIGWQVAAIYYTTQGLTLLSISTFLLIGTPGVFLPVLATFLVFQAMYTISLVTLLFCLAFRHYKIPPWKIYRRG